MSSFFSTLNSISTCVNFAVDTYVTGDAILRAFKLSRKERLTCYEKISLVGNVTFASLTITQWSSKVYSNLIIHKEFNPDFYLKIGIAISGVDVLRGVSDKLSKNSNSACRWTTDDTLDTLTIILYRTSNSSSLGCTYRPDLCGDKVRNTAYACQSVAIIIEKRKALHFCIIRAIALSQRILSARPREEHLMT